MNRNFQFSKQTEDRVKLAKHFIENKYQSIIKLQQATKISWQNLFKVLEHSKLESEEKQSLTKKLLDHESTQKRLWRAKDCLTNYELHELIGKGAFGEVRLARAKATGEIVSIKRMEKKRLIGKRQISNAYLQRQCLIKNSSKWLVQLKSTFQDKRYVYLVMEFVPGGDLLHLLVEKDVFTEEETRFYVGQLVLAVEQIHTMNFIHRDIKPDNILIDREGHLKISDFGLSKYLEKGEELQMLKMTPAKAIIPLSKMASVRKHTELRSGLHRKFSKVGTPDYISPQILTQETYDHRVDIWGIGVIMFQCLFGYPPFSHHDSTEVCRKVINWNEYLEFPAAPKVSNEAKSLISSIVCGRNERLTLQQIKMHPFLTNFNWNKPRHKTPPYVPNLKNELDTNNFERYEETDWLHQNQDDVCHKRCSSSLEVTKFAGFDFRRLPKQNIFQTVTNQIVKLGKLRTENSKSPNQMKMKMILTEYENHSPHKWFQCKRDTQIVPTKTKKPLRQGKRFSKEPKKPKVGVFRKTIRNINR